MLSMLGCSVHQAGLSADEPVAVIHSLAITPGTALIQQDPKHAIKGLAFSFGNKIVEGRRKGCLGFLHLLLLRLAGGAQGPGLLRRRHRRRHSAGRHGCWMTLRKKVFRYVDRGRSGEGGIPFKGVQVLDESLQMEFEVVKIAGNGN